MKNFKFSMGPIDQKKISTIPLRFAVSKDFFPLLPKLLLVMFFYEIIETYLPSLIGRLLSNR